jgi:uncharacterized protein
MFLQQIFKGERSLSSYVPTLVLIGVIFLVSQLIAGVVLTIVVNMSETGNINAIQTLDFDAMGIDANIGFLILIFSFVPAFVGLLLIRTFHKRPFLSAITSRVKLDKQRIFFGMLVWFVILAGSTAIDALILNPDDYIVTFNGRQFIPLVIIALIFLPFQIGFEEIFFRGYLYQAMGQLFRYPVLAWIVTSVMFGLIHGGNPEIKEYGFWVMMPSYILLGMFLGIVTILDDGLELALGIHFINNFFLAVGVNYAGSALKVNSAFKVLTMDPTTSWYSILLSGTLFTLIAWWRYKWKNSRQLLFTPVKPNS